jgi:hypothetical protein
MPRLVEQIISGGQTGADLGALRAARELGVPTGGIAPRGWLTENGPQEELLKRFGLRECDEDGYPARTRRNVEMADGTLLIGSYETGGTRLTYEIAMELNKPTFHVPLVIAPNIDELRYWLGRFGIGVLNVAGNRESQSPGIEEFTRQLLVSTLK